MNKISKSANIAESAQIEKDVIVGHNCIIEDDVIIGAGTYIDSNTIIRSGVRIGVNSFIGANCIIGEYQMDFDKKWICHKPLLEMGDNVLVRSGSIIYSGSTIGSNFQTGHNVTIREKTKIRNNVSVGTLSDIQGNCEIGSYVRLHSNVHVGQLSKIDDFVWIYPYVVLTNDPTPPSNNFVGVHVNSFAIVATGAIIMPGVEIGTDSLVAAGAIVTKNVSEFSVVGGNPAKVMTDIRNVKNRFTGEFVYPWREHFKKYMPWSESDFDTWYKGLDFKEKCDYTINIERRKLE